MLYIIIDKFIVACVCLCCIKNGIWRMLLFIYLFIFVACIRFHFFLNNTHAHMHAFTLMEEWILVRSHLSIAWIFYKYDFVVCCPHRRFLFQMLCTLNVLIFGSRIQRTTMGLLLVNLSCSGMSQNSLNVKPLRQMTAKHSKIFMHACRYAFPIKCSEVIYGDDEESVVEIRAEYDPSKTTKPKVFVPLIVAVVPIRKS